MNRCDHQRACNIGENGNGVERGLAGGIKDDSEILPQGDNAYQTNENRKGTSPLYNEDNKKRDGNQTCNPAF
jgi:hypothetical protein